MEPYKRIRGDSAAKTLLFQKPAIEGYTLRFLHNPVQPPPPSEPTYSIVQVGEIPQDAVYLTFRSWFGLFAVSVDLPANGDYYVTERYRTDVSRYGGRSVELKIRMHDPYLLDSKPHELDSFAFVVPEPSTYAMAILGLVMLGWRWWRSRSES